MKTYLKKVKKLFQGYYPIIELENKWIDSIYQHIKWFSLSSGISHHYLGTEYYMSITCFNFWFRIGLNIPGSLYRGH